MGLESGGQAPPQEYTVNVGQLAVREHTLQLRLRLLGTRARLQATFFLQFPPPPRRKKDALWEPKQNKNAKN